MVRSLRKKNSISDKSYRYTRALGAFPDKGVPDIDCFTDGPIVHYVLYVKNTFVDYCTKMIQMIKNRFK